MERPGPGRAAPPRRHGKIGRARTLSEGEGDRVGPPVPVFVTRGGKSLGALLQVVNEEFEPAPFPTVPPMLGGAIILGTTLPTSTSNGAERPTSVVNVLKSNGVLILYIYLRVQLIFWTAVFLIV